MFIQSYQRYHLGRKITLAIFFFSILLIAKGKYTSLSTALAGENAVNDFTEEPRFFQVSNNISSDIDVESIGEGKVAWLEIDQESGDATLKFFNGQQTQEVYTYSSSELSQIGSSRPNAIIFGNCLLYKFPDFKGDWIRWLIYDPALPEPEEPLVSDDLYPIAEGDKVVWVRSVYENESDTEPQSTELRMYTCGSGTDVLAGVAPDGTQTGPAPFNPDAAYSFGEFQLRDNLVIWTHPIQNPSGFWYEGDVTTEVWVHDDSGTRKTWECTYPISCDLENPGFDFENLIGWQQPLAQTAIDGGVIALRAYNWETFTYGLFIHQVGSGAGTYMFPGSGDYFDMLIRDGYVAWVHWGETFGSVEDILVYNISTGDTISVPYDNSLVGLYLMERGIIFYQDYPDIYLYDIASNTRQIVAVNTSLDSRGVKFNNGRAFLAEETGSDLVIKRFDGATTAKELARFTDASMDDLGWYYLDQDGRAWWTMERTYTFLTCDDPSLGTGTDWDLFTWDPWYQWVRQVTPAKEINDTFEIFPSFQGTIVWVGERKYPQCGDLYPYGPDQVFLGGGQLRTISGDVMVKDGDGNVRKLPDLEMVFSWASDNTFSDTTTLTVHTDANGFYQVTPPETGNVQGVWKFEIRLKDRQGWIEVQHGNPAALVTFETAAQNFDNLVSASFDINISNTAAFKNPSIGSANQHRLDDLAEIYFFTHQAALFADQNLSLPMDGSLPEEIRAFSASSGVFHSTTAPDYINIEVNSSSLNHPDWPDNRDWHEFNHHIMADSLLGGDNQMPTPRLTPSTQVDVDDNRNGVFNETLLAWTSPTASTNYSEGPTTFNSGVDKNHLGYANSTTTDSLTEGFAEFLSLVIADTMTTDNHPEVYKWAGGPSNLEALRQTWTWPEEFAVAALLWDLYDSNVDSYNLDALQGWNLGKTLDDRVDLTLEDLWSRLNQATIQDMKDVYDALADLTQDSDGDGLRDVDEIFIMHGFFVDDNPFKKYNAGEEIGRAAYAQQVLGWMDVNVDNFLWDDGDGVYDPPSDRNLQNERIRVPANTNRRDLEPLDNSVLRLSFQDSQRATPVQNLTLKVAITYEAPYEDFSHTYEVFMEEDGDLPIYMPILTATATITATAGGYADSAPFTTTSAEYWQAMDADAEFVAEHTFTLIPIPSYVLTVTLEGDGFGSVVITPTKEIDCAPNCSAVLPADSSVTLTALPETGSTFAGWGGDCAPWGSDLTAQIVLNTDMVCTAQFDIAIDPYPYKVYLPAVQSN